ncbi:sensor domain-containing phosphodiesterase [Pseudocolwellia agarivorans]|uniref:sensor domain-containing phosphodiesterase n=1 Tax=Pseudocolwellia agarivorans TaxID=1911682 RepID=UPI0009876E01|nr:EAL domain-containing protein [Pseudocolwellia agarivorans]
MQVGEKENTLATKQIPKLKSLLKKYRQARTIQSGLLQLSELASSVTDMNSFYSALEAIIKTILITDSFHITLLNSRQNLSLAYSHNPSEKSILARHDSDNWENSLTGLVFSQAKIICCNAQERDELSKKYHLSLYNSLCHSWLGVPLKRGNQIIGVIALQSYDSITVFGERDSQLLEFIAEHLVTAIDRVRSRELLEKNIIERTQKLTETNEKLQKEIAERQKAVKIHKALLAISEITATTTDLDSFYQVLHKEITTLIPSNNFYIALTSQNNQWIDFPYYKDEYYDIAESRQFSNGLTELAIKVGEPLLVKGSEIITLDEDGNAKYHIHAINSLKNKTPKTWLGAPLIDQGVAFGVFAVHHYQDVNAYQLSDLDLVEFVSQHIATAILRIRSQAEIQKSNEALEQAINERTKELQSTNLNLRMQIEERRKAEAQLYYEAHHDALTKLPNRAMLTDRLSYSLRHLKRHPSHQFAVLFIDLDRFKVINDTLGHHAGDLFLVEIAARLQDCVRDNDILARLGGDEFVILLDSLQSEDDVEDVASRIINKVAMSFELEGHTVHSNASIGIAMCGKHYNDSNEILRDADAAMYQAKSLGCGRYVFFDESMREQLIASMTLEQELRVAIKERQFELHYQKISDLENTKTIGFEALLRWNHPEKGLLTPSEFLFMAEETGMILDIETWVIEDVCLQLKHWQSSVEYKNIFIGVNLSGRHLTQANQLSKLIHLIEANTVEPQRLILEFTESAFAQHTELALKGLKKLKEFGVKLALDDYGAGLSSLNFLHGYPFEFIKLDRSFIKTLNLDNKNLSLVKALHELGGNFGYRLVAEGIESAEMLEKLKNVGCDFGQGFHINRPCRIDNEDNSIIHVING